MNRQCSSCGGFCRKSGCERENVEPTPDPIYTAPPKKEWVGLTDEDMRKLRYLVDWTAPLNIAALATVIEAQLKEKNT